MHQHRRRRELAVFCHARQRPDHGTCCPTNIVLGDEILTVLGTYYGGPVLGTATKSDQGVLKQPYSLQWAPQTTRALENRQNKGGPRL